MSEEALDTVRRYMPAFERAPADAGVDFWHPEITWRAIEGAPDDVGVIRGREALRDYYAQWIDTFADIRAELVEDLIDAGDDVVAVTRIHAQMKHSDATVEMTVAIVFTVRDGKIFRGREYATREEALEAAGLGRSASRD
jgi:ketosteroid isomerase-like protein